MREEEIPIDMAFIQLTSMSRMGFTLRDWGLITFGKWIDLYETYKKQSNFETNHGIYTINEEPKIDSLDDI